nr:hypothetical protein [uncultured Dysosmobacter sp.]
MNEREGGLMMAALGIILLTVGMLAVRGRLMKLAFHRGGRSHSGQNGKRPPERDHTSS